MGHNLNFNEATGRYSFFSVKEKAWHNLGQIVSDYPTSAEAIKHAGLDYEVVKSPLYTTGNDLLQAGQDLETTNTQLTVPNYFAIIPCWAWWVKITTLYKTVMRSVSLMLL